MCALGEGLAQFQELLEGCWEEFRVTIKIGPVFHDIPENKVVRGEIRRLFEILYHSNERS